MSRSAVGVPVVCSDVGENATVVAHGETGFVVETPEQWGEALRALASSPERRADLGRAGRARVERGFTVDVAARALADLVLECRGAARSSP